jgi:hypothetical protein
MKKRPVVLSTLLLGALASALFWLGTTASVRSNSKPLRADEVKTGSPFARVNEKARIAKTGEPTAIRELADKVFEATSLPELSPRTLDQMKERIVRSEIAYRSTGKGGVPEKNIVKMINNLADKLGLPDYAKVDGILVRQTRVKMLTRMPQLFSQAVTREEKGQGGVGSALKTEMSPMEASFLANLLLQQKMINESYQVTPQEGRTSLHKWQMQRWQAFRKFKASGQKGSLPREQPTEGVSMREPSARSMEMSQALSRAKAKLRLPELLNLADASLDDLGIAK